MMPQHVSGMGTLACASISFRVTRGALITSIAQKMGAGSSHAQMMGLLKSGRLTRASELGEWREGQGAVWGKWRESQVWCRSSWRASCEVRYVNRCLHMAGAFLLGS
jgi:hypothetical protein